MHGLESRLAVIGFAELEPPELRPGGRAALPLYDLERVLLDAVAAIPKQPELEPVLLAWIRVHGARVIVEKLGKLARRRLAPLERLGPVAAYAREVLLDGQKWRRLAGDAESPAAPAQPVDAERVLLTPTELARSNRQYRNRLLYGPVWRADVITAIELGHDSAAEIARAVGCSYKPAHRVLTEHRIATAALAGTMGAPAKFDVKRHRLALP